MICSFNEVRFHNNMYFIASLYLFDWAQDCFPSISKRNPRLCANSYNDFILVEARGVEPLSENTLERTSPGADPCSDLTHYKSKEQTLQCAISFIL